MMVIEKTGERVREVINKNRLGKMGVFEVCVRGNWSKMREEGMSVDVVKKNRRVKVCSK